REIPTALGALGTNQGSCFFRTADDAEDEDAQGLTKTLPGNRERQVETEAGGQEALEQPQERQTQTPTSRPWHRYGSPRRQKRRHPRRQSLISRLRFSVHLEEEQLTNDPRPQRQNGPSPAQANAQADEGFPP